MKPIRHVTRWLTAPNGKRVRVRVPVYGPLSLDEIQASPPRKLAPRLGRSARRGEG